MDVVQPPSRPADRYGDRPASPQRTRGLLWVLAGFTALIVAFAGWSALRGAVTTVHSSDLAVHAIDSGTAEVTWSVRPPAGRGAVCTVRAVNARLDEVGRLDVEVSADQVKRDGEEGSLRVVTRLRTSEGATGGGVKTCLVR